MLHFLLGDATAPTGEGRKIIVHVCNDIGGWGKGFVGALSRRSRAPEMAYRKWFASGEGFALGEVQFVPFAPEIEVANLVGQHDILRPENLHSLPPVRYEAIEKGLRTVAARAQETDATVHMPRIGCGLAGGSWEQIEPIIKRTLCDAGVAVFVYDLPAKS